MACRQLRAYFRDRSRRGRHAGLVEYLGPLLLIVDHGHHVAEIYRIGELGLAVGQRGHIDLAAVGHNHSLLAGGVNNHHAAAYLGILAVGEAVLAHTAARRIPHIARAVGIEG